MSDCKHASNNKFFNCPPRMADGRHFTDYRPNCDLHASLNKNSMDSNAMRNWMTRNADAIMAGNTRSAIAKNGCGPCREPFGTMLPEQSKVRCDKRTCRYTVTDVNGLGMGRTFGEKPLEGVQGFGVRFVRDSTNCCGNPDEVFNYYGDAAKVEDAEYLERKAVTGGEAMHGGDPEAYDV